MLIYTVCDGPRRKQKANKQRLRLKSFKNIRLEKEKIKSHISVPPQNTRNKPNILNTQLSLCLQQFVETGTSRYTTEASDLIRAGWKVYN